MAGIALCKFKECEKTNSCKRFILQIGTEMDMKNVCNAENNYKWYWHEETSVQEQGNNKKKEESK